MIVDTEKRGNLKMDDFLFEKRPTSRTSRDDVIECLSDARFAVDELTRSIEDAGFTIDSNFSDSLRDVAIKICEQSESLKETSRKLDAVKMSYETQSESEMSARNTYRASREEVESACHNMFAALRHLPQRAFDDGLISIDRAEELDHYITSKVEEAREKKEDAVDKIVMSQARSVWLSGRLPGFYS